jgi:hypothetical protein
MDKIEIGFETGTRTMFFFLMAEDWYREHGDGKCVDLMQTEFPLSKISDLPDYWKPSDCMGFRCGDIEVWRVISKQKEPNGVPNQFFRRIYVYGSEIELVRFKLISSEFELPKISWK